MSIVRSVFLLAMNKVVCVTIVTVRKYNVVFSYSCRIKVHVENCFIQTSCTVQCMNAFNAFSFIMTLLMMVIIQSEHSCPYHVSIVLTKLT